MIGVDEKLPVIGELGAGVESAKRELAKAEDEAKQAAQKVELLARAAANLNTRLVALSRACDAAVEALFGQVIRWFAASDAALPVDAAQTTDALFHERSLLGRMQGVLVLRLGEARLTWQQAQAQADYERASVAEMEAALEEAQFVAKLSRAGLGQALLKVEQAPHVEAQQSAAAQKAAAVRTLRDVEQRLAAYRERHGADLRISLG